MRASAGRWKRRVMVLVASVLCLFHPIGIALFDQWPRTQRSGYVIAEDRGYRWTLATAIGIRRVVFEAFDSPGMPDAFDPAPERWELPKWAPLPDRSISAGLDSHEHYVVGRLYALGFPFVGLRSADYATPKGAPAPIGLPMPGSLGGDAPIPTWVYWPGMLLNLLVWNAAGLVVFVGIDAWVGLRRIRRGRCVRCGYEIGMGADACPECGVGKGETERRRDGEAE